jgi:hypothetical protein
MFALLPTTRGHRLAVLAALATLAIPAHLPAQGTGPQRGVTVVYRKVAVGKGADQRKFAETTWKKFYQALVDDNRYHGAMIMRLTAPYATGAAADWATVLFPVKAPSLAPLETAPGEAAARKAGLANLQAYIDQQNGLSTAVRSEWLTTTMRTGAAQAGNYMRGVRYLVPVDKRGAMNDWMRDVSLPLNTQAVKAGRYTAWGVTTPSSLIGGADEAGYSHSLATLVKDANGFDGGPYQVSEARLKEVFGNKMNISQYFTRQTAVFEGTKTVSTKIWEIVAVVGKVPEIAPQ